MFDTQLLLKYKNDVEIYINERLHRNFDDDSLKEICKEIECILFEWTGNTYVGKKKEKDLENAYQEFFLLLHDFLEFCLQNEQILDEKETSLADLMRFRGTVYRCLGFNDSRNHRKNEKVEPRYSDIYVSWSKSETNSYIEEKLYGIRTWMKAEIKEPDFGIDIHGFELWCEKWLGESPFITRGKEKEVVYPTLEKYIVEIKYI